MNNRRSNIEVIADILMLGQAGKLRDMPDVGKVDRKLLAKAHFPSLLKKFMPLPSSRTSCKERILVTLKQPSDYAGTGSAVRLT